MILFSLVLITMNPAAESITYSDFKYVKYI